jgi:hypothetical protein
MNVRQVRRRLLGSFVARLRLGREALLDGAGVGFGCPCVPDALLIV